MGHLKQLTVGDYEKTFRDLGSGFVSTAPDTFNQQRSECTQTDS